MFRPGSAVSVSSLALTLALLTACDQSQTATQTTTTQGTAANTQAETTQAEEGGNNAEVATAPAPSNKAPALPLPLPDPSSATQPLQSEVARQDVAGRDLIVRAEADFQVPDVVKAARAIEELTRGAQGFVISSSINNQAQGETHHTYQGGQRLTLTTYVRRAELKVRVPRARLDRFLSEVQAQVGFLRSSQFTAQDVTFDIQKTQLEEELGRLRSGAFTAQVRQPDSAQGQAGNLSAIEKQFLAQREAEYAALSERDLRDQIAYSTVRLTFDQPAQTHQVLSEDPQAVIRQHTPPFAQRLAASLRGGWVGLTEVVLALARVWPLLLSLGVVAALWRQVNRRPVKESGQAPPPGRE